MLTVRRSLAAHHNETKDVPSARPVAGHLRGGHPILYPCEEYPGNERMRK